MMGLDPNRGSEGEDASRDGRLSRARSPRRDPNAAYDAQGPVNDEYTDDSLDIIELDAMDVPGALRDESVLADVADNGDGIEEIDLDPHGAVMDTYDTGARHRVVDEADMGLGSEPRSAEELEEASIGHALRGRGAVTRDDEVHGELLFDSPLDDPEDELAEGGDTLGDDAPGRSMRDRDRRNDD
jgi:hypothetical protein